MNKSIMTWIRVRFKYIVLLIATIVILNFFGVFTHLFEIDFYKEFHYPLDSIDILKYAKQVRYKQKPDILPINVYNYTFLLNPKDKCKFADTMISPQLTIFVKTALPNFNRRNAIRNSWGFEHRYSDVLIRTVFLIGIPTIKDQILQKSIDIEMETYNDLLQSDFIDTYFNNTIKTMMGFKWAVEYCIKSKFFVFLDDDFYASTKNILRFIRDPVNYPEYLEEADETIRKLSRKLSDSQKEAREMMREENVKQMLLGNSANTINNKNQIKKILKSNEFNELYLQNNDINNKRYLRKKRNIYDKQLSKDVRLFAGFVFKSSPHRHKTSKWHVSLEEYPYHMWPSYVTAGAFILSREALIDMYYVSMYTKHFRFDDIYLGIVALKAKIELLHSEEIYFHKALYSGPQSYKYVIASHGYDNPQEMVKIWSETRANGHS